MKKIPQDVIGNIAILKFPKRTLWITKKLKARKFLKENKNVTTVLEKIGKFSGRLRTHETKWLAGEKTKNATYKENNSIFKFNVDEAYFSPRLSNERKVTTEEVLRYIKKKKIKNPKILVMFAGVAPYPIAIARKLKEEKITAKIYSNELNKKANEYSKRNVRLNKLENYIEILPGDANKIPSKIKEKFDAILMPRPNLDETFLKTTLKLAKKGALVLYHGFGTEDEVLNEIKKDTKNKISKIEIRKAGDIASGKWRWLASFNVLTN